MMKLRLTAILILAILGVIALSCGDDYKTPEDIKNQVAFLDARSALSVFPFGTKPIYMFFNAEWCHYCNSMKKEMFTRPEIIKYMNEHFTCISVMPESLGTFTFNGEEVTINEFMKALKFQGYPTHYFFAPDGELKGVRVGYIELLDFKQLLKYIGEGYVYKQNFATFLQLPESRLDTVYGEF
ncbi:MAG: thioredoxin fold domain-containing protein [candidate division Zixibacteria bacterium]|nr:thioredoxin fold domain-containing protein [candidate division Zixibacteria bacterium]